MRVDNISSKGFQGGKNVFIWKMPPKLSKEVQFRLPLKDNKKAIVDIEENNNYRVVRMAYCILDKSKVVENKVFSNKKGFSIERFTEIVDVLQNRAKEGVDFFSELVTAQVKHIG